ncbi:c-type cytochrome domain-containing protein [Tundrisphaera sp. TA3]|uniref:c-type cytochrome domain-containing protein n=1 Tax=Tundrisphaera sp. TA3 TaxID=3435775 RepID=UPI003EBC582F
MSIRTGRRWGIAIGLAGCLVAGAEVLSADGPGVARLVAQKAGKKKSIARKDAPKSADDAMEKAEGDGKAAMPKAEAAAPAAADDGKLSFAKDIAPIFAANCVGCHSGTGNGKVRGKYDMTTFALIMAGGKRGVDIVPEDPEGSTLVRMITGEETPRMPQGNQVSLSAGAQAKIATWVKEGARLDAGIDPNALLTKYAASAADLRKTEIARMPADRRDALTRETGLARWKKVNNSEPEITTGTSFMLFAEMPKARHDKLLKTMETQLSSVNRIVGVPRDKAVGTGEKVSLYVFKDRNTFVEFVRTTENQEVESDEVARVRLNVETPYVVALDPAGGGEEAAPAPAKKSGRSRKGAAESAAASSGQRTLAGIMVESLVVGICNQAGKPPRWISFGLGAYLASTIEGGSSYYRGLRAEAAENYRIGWIPRCNEVLGGQAPNEAIRAVGFGLFEWMAANAPPQTLSTFLREMLEGQDKLDEAISNVLGIANREAFLQMSGEWIGGRYAGSR